jgi:hypothetical protein
MQFNSFTSGTRCGCIGAEEHLEFLVDLQFKNKINFDLHNGRMRAGNLSIFRCYPLLIRQVHKKFNLDFVSNS